MALFLIALVWWLIKGGTAELSSAWPGPFGLLRPVSDPAPQSRCRCLVRGVSRRFVMDIDKQKAKADAFRVMHRGAQILLLPNAWDVASARVFEESGFGAIATTSAGIAFTLGYPDGQRISREEMLGVVRRIAAGVRVPVTADVEAGYGDGPEDAARTARDVAKAGAVGMNLEDATGDPQRPLLELTRQVERVMLQLEAPEKRYDAALRRLAAYRDAGADCVFVPGLRDAETIGRLVKDLRCPVNILGGPGSPSVPELEKMSVARVSVGSGAMRATLGLVRRIAGELKGSGTYEALEGAISYADVNGMME